jgi:hypothetical protein
MSQSTFQQLVGNQRHHPWAGELLMAPMAKMQNGPAETSPAGGERPSISG